MKTPVETSVKRPEMKVAVEAMSRPEMSVETRTRLAGARRRRG
jgi:hypothetical protein